MASTVIGLISMGVAGTMMAAWEIREREDQIYYGIAVTCEAIYNGWNWFWEGVRD